MKFKTLFCHLVLSLTLIGCANIPSQHKAEGLSVIVSEHIETAVDALGMRWPRHENPSTSEIELESCLENTLIKSDTDFSIIPANDFRQAVFPNFSRAEAPRTAESITHLLGHPEFKKRTEALGLRYLALVGGSTQYQYKDGAVKFYLVGGYSAAIAWFWGKSIWNNEASLNALVLDLNKPAKEELVNIETRDDSSFGIYLYVPIWTPSNVKKTACITLSQQISDAVMEMRRVDVSH